MNPEAEAGQTALKEERHQYILELLGSEGRVLAADLSSRYGVSEDTIRRDLRQLASSGKIQRVHGGALPRRAEAVPFVSRQQIDMESKIGIARAAAAMIRDGQVVLIDGGTTNLRIASYLSRERSATIVTNSPPLVLALADHPKLSVLMLGGNFLKEERVTTGIETVRRVESIRADLCFLGMCSLHPEVGITVGNQRRSVREASDDRGFNRSGRPDFAWENGDIAALPGRSCFPTDTFDHRCVRRRCPESLPLPRHRSHQYVNRSGSTLEENFHA